MLLNDRLRWLMFAVVAIVAGVAMFVPQVQQGLVNVLEVVQSAGVWGPALFIVVYILACLLFLPGSILTIGAGYVFGIRVGIITVSIGSTLGAVAAFLLARTLMRGWVVRAMAANSRFQALDKAVGEQGFKIVLLTRLSPVLPFNLLNFAFGVTKVSLRDYMLASWIGMLPGAILYIYVGSAMKSLAELTTGKRHWTVQEQVLFGLGLAVTAVLSIVFARLARRALKEMSSMSQHVNDRSSPDHLQPQKVEQF